MGFGAAGGWTGAGAAFHAQDGAISYQAFQAREHVEHRSHVGGLFLHPDYVGVLAVAVEFGGEFFLRERVELFEEDDRGAGIFSPVSLGLQFVADLPVQIKMRSASPT